MVSSLSIIAVAILGGLALCTTLDPEAGPRIRRRFDSDWRFHRGDAPEAREAGFDDSAWRQADLPHDWSVEDLPAPAEHGPFDPDSVGGGAVGFTVGGVGWYRKSFTLPEDLGGKRITLTFDGVYMDAELWLNGTPVGSHPYGYTAFEVDLTPHLRFGEANELAVRVNASGKTSRWYPGSGIYRHVWLTVTDPVHLALWGVAVTRLQCARDRRRGHRYFAHRRS